MQNNSSEIYPEYTEDILLIANFMNLAPTKGINEQTGKEYYYYNNVALKDFEAVPFYNEWNDLMPVVEKN